MSGDQEAASTPGSMGDQRLGTGIAPGIDGARAVLDRWISALEDLNPGAAAMLYANEGLAFWGTFGDHCRRTRAQTVDYFERFLDLASLKCILEETHWRFVGDDLVLATGSYLFELVKTDDPALTRTRARFTFVFHRTSGDSWQIIEHHSSQFPENGF